MEKLNFILIVDSPQSRAHVFSVEKLFGRPIKGFIIKTAPIYTIYSKLLYKKLVPNVRCIIVYKTYAENQLKNLMSQIIINNLMVFGNNL